MGRTVVGVTQFSATDLLVVTEKWVWRFGPRWLQRYRVEEKWVGGCTVWHSFPSGRRAKPSVERWLSEVEQWHKMKTKV
jgi:hypothetical protein